MSETEPYSTRQHGIPIIQAVKDYDGGPSVRISATQIDFATPTEARRVVNEWIEFFEDGPSAIRELAFVSRTPKRLFNALSSQTQLTRLGLKWGDYEDLEVLSGMQNLQELVLRGASNVRTLEPLSRLRGVTSLEVESLRKVSDLSPIARMRGVIELDLGGNWMAPRIAHVESIRFLREMPQLEHLLLHSIIVDDLDYSPLLDLPRLRDIRVMKARGMTPPIDELIAALPWSK